MKLPRDSRPRPSTPAVQKPSAPPRPASAPRPEQQIIRDIPLIQRYARHNEAQDFRFRAFLKAGSDLSNADLDSVVRQTTDAVWSKIDCLACGHCCRSLQIVVDNADIQRLAGRLNVTPQQFSRKYVAVADDRTKHFKTAPCPFLADDGKRCTVYEDRPQACRDFPYLHAPAFRRRMLMMIENNAVCPIVFNVWQMLKQKLWPRQR